MKHVTQVCLTRNDWKHLPVPDCMATIKLFSKCSSGEHRIWCEHITGASMTAEQLKYFTDTQVCSLCQQPDSVYHRVMECEATADVRAQYSDHISQLAEMHPCHVQFPAVYMPDQHEFHEWYYRQVSWPVADSVINKGILDSLSAGRTPNIFLDGTCDHPMYPGFRRTAYAIVYQYHFDDVGFNAEVDKFKTTLRIPAHFSVLVTGEVRGSQQIDRAELAEAILVFQNYDHANIYSDSQYVLDRYADLLTLEDIHVLHTTSNYDLLFQWWPHVRKPHIAMHTVKAHALQPWTDSYQDT